MHEHILLYVHNNYALCIMGTVDGCGYDDQHKCTIVTLVGRASFSPNLTSVALTTCSDA